MQAAEGEEKGGGAQTLAGGNLLEKEGEKSGSLEGGKEGVLGSDGKNALQKQKNFKRMDRQSTEGSSNISLVRVGQKRSGEDMEIDESGKVKNPKENDVAMEEETYNTNVKAGLSVQLRGTQ